MDKKEKKYWLFFSLIKEFGPKRFNFFLRQQISPKQLYDADYGQLNALGLGNRLSTLILERKRIINLDKEWDELEKNKINIFTLAEKEYPSLLKEIYCPPPVLFARGRMIAQEEYLVAVVGTRKPSRYGLEACHKIVRRLSANKITIVSGLALGIDAVAHQAALEEKGRTIAVLGCGPDLIHPLTNRRLAEKILEGNGLILSEFSRQTPPLKQHFPQRNRIIAGLSLGALIVEAPEKSGALITARYALEQNREVFALPGSIFSPNSAGTNNLLKLGARVVTSEADILDIFNLENAEKFQENQKIYPETNEERIILNILDSEPLHIDKIIQESKLEPSIINSAPSLMEVKGKVKNVGGMHYILGR